MNSKGGDRIDINRVTVTVCKGENEDQYHVPIVPRVGEYFEHWSSRDENGNYHPEGRTHRTIHGYVKRIRYHMEEGGKDSRTYTTTMYIYIELTDQPPLPEEWITWPTKIHEWLNEIDQKLREIVKDIDRIEKNTRDNHFEITQIRKMLNNEV